MFTWLVLCVLLAAPAQACGSRQKLVGAPEDVSPDDPELQKAVHFAVSEYNKASNDMFASKVVRILSAKQQIVAGVKYTFEVELGRTQCKQGQVHDLETCNFSETSHKTFCKFEVLSIAWAEETSLQNKMCKPSNN